jgi:hypothetical protein
MTQKHQEVEFSVIGQGNHYNGNFENPKANLVIKNNDQWTILKNHLTSYSIAQLNETNIDFNKYLLLPLLMKYATVEDILSILQKLVKLTEV